MGAERNVRAHIRIMLDKLDLHLRSKRTGAGVEVFEK
jgi:hypothetical protein